MDGEIGPQGSLATTLPEQSLGRCSPFALQPRFESGIDVDMHPCGKSAIHGFGWAQGPSLQHSTMKQIGIKKASTRRMCSHDKVAIKEHKQYLDSLVVGYHSQMLVQNMPLDVSTC
jgi:hypothetical protein